MWRVSCKKRERRRSLVVILNVLYSVGEVKSATAEHSCFYVLLSSSSLCLFSCPFSVPFFLCSRFIPHGFMICPLCFVLLVFSSLFVILFSFLDSSCCPSFCCCCCCLPFCYLDFWNLVILFAFLFSYLPAPELCSWALFVKQDNVMLRSKSS